MPASARESGSGVGVAPPTYNATRADVGNEAGTAVCQIQSQQLLSPYVESIVSSVHLSNGRDGLNGRCDERCDCWVRINPVQIVRNSRSDIPGCGVSPIRIKRRIQISIGRE